MEAYKQYSKEEREYHVEQWRSSGKSQKVYSTEAGISVVSLHYWVYGKKKKEKERAKVPAFVPIHIQEETSPSLEITLELPGGIRIILQGGVSAAYLKSLIS
jgi:hypothetical protein